MKEEQLQREIIAVLHKYGFPAWLTHDSRHHPIEKGIADINCILPGGKFLAIEVKLPKEKPSSEQDAWLMKVSRGGGIACVAQSLNDIYAILEREEGIW
jgi:hypothetical protein